VASSARRGVLWGLLVAALIVIFAAAAWQLRHRPEPPPVLGTVPELTLTNRDGRTIHRADLEGSPWIADFIFTRCPASCPMMTSRMARLVEDLPAGTGVRFVSISVDPEHDTPEVLERYAASYKAPARWLFLTGDGRQIYRLSQDGFKLGVDATPQASGGETAEPILHSTRFVLVDGEGRIRGYYDAFDAESMKGLTRDLHAISD
jgi:protein SCO1/2